MLTAFQGLFVVFASVALSAVLVLAWRRVVPFDFLERDSIFVSNTYPIIGLIYGVFLGFTIVITWGHFLDAERSTTQEVTRLSELWRDSEVMPEKVRRDAQCRLYRYAVAVVASDWESMATAGTHSSESTRAYERIWDAYYTYSPVSATETAFYSQAISELNELGRERRQRGLYASAQVQPFVRILVIGGGLLTVLFSLLIPVRSALLQVVVTCLLGGLISFSIFLAFALERPFSGDLSVKPDAFKAVVTSFEQRSPLRPCTESLD